MTEALQILWTPAGEKIPNLGSRALVDVSDGDTPNIRMPIRMLSIDTPEVTAKSENGASKVDEKFAELADWIRADKAPVSSKFADYILPKIEMGSGGTLQYEQGKSASAWYKAQSEKRLRKSNGRKRNLFISTADAPFDNYHRVLAYVAPSYSSKELNTMSRRERATFNLDLVESGWAAPFIIFPNIPGELDLPMFLEAARKPQVNGEGQYTSEFSLPGFEYRMLEKLYGITKKLVAGENFSTSKKLGWRTRYAADARTRILYGPEDYMTIPIQYRIWMWPQDVQKAISMLNLIPSADLTE